MSRIASGDLGRALELEPDFVAGQQPLVEQPQDASLAVEGAEERPRRSRGGPHDEPGAVPPRIRDGLGLAAGQRRDGVHAPDLSRNRVAVARP